MAISVSAAAGIPVGTATAVVTYSPVVLDVPGRPVRWRPRSPYPRPATTCP